MRACIIVLIWVLSALTWGCSRTCKTGQANVGDRCVAVPDAGLDVDADSVGVDPDEVMGDSSSEEDGGGPVGAAGHLDASGAAGPDAGGAGADASNSADAAPSGFDGTVSATDASVPANDGSSSGTDAACEGPSCTVDACHPNPCGHGSCRLAAGSFSCNCEPGWLGNGICDVNTNAALGALTVSAGTLYPAFNSSINEYSVDLPLGSAEVSLNPTVAVPDGATVRLGGDVIAPGAAIARLVELNKPVRVAIEVRADSGATRNYTVTLRRTLVVQATLKVNSNAHIESFGNQLVLSGNLLVASTVSSQSSDFDGPRFTRYAIYTRYGSTWQELDEVAQSYARIALGDKWLVVSQAASVSVTSLDGFGTGRGSLRYRLAADANELGFGNAVAVLGDTAVVASDTLLHIYDLNAIGADSLPTQTRVDVTAASTVAMDNDVIAAARGLERAPMLVRREAGTWKVIADPFSGKAPGSTAIGSFGGHVAVPQEYGCLVSCVGAKAELNVFEPMGGGFTHRTASIPVAPAVPPELDPSGFGIGGLAQGADFAVVGAPLVRSRRSPVARMADPFLPVPQDSPTFYGAAYLFVRKQSGWVADAVLSAVEEDAARQPIGMGKGVSYSNGRLAVSAPGHGPSLGEDWRTNNFSGAIYIFGPDCAQIPAGASVPGC